MVDEVAAKYQIDTSPEAIRQWEENDPFFIPYTGTYVEGYKPKRNELVVYSTKEKAFKIRPFTSGEDTFFNVGGAKNVVEDFSPGESRAYYFSPNHNTWVTADILPASPE